MRFYTSQGLRPRKGLPFGESLNGNSKREHILADVNFVNMGVKQGIIGRKKRLQGVNNFLPLLPL